MTKYYIGYSLSIEERFKASSGGIGTAITRYLLDSQTYGTSITFTYNVSQHKYEPRFIYNSSEINKCGSIYQDLNIAKFVKDNIHDIYRGIVLTASPCQVPVIKKLLDDRHIENFIISFCCSGQTSIEGTWKYFELLGIKKEDVIGLQYRGDGWPSGIKIKLKDGSEEFRPNWSEPWVTLHSSYFYRPKRCFYCTFDTSYLSDISIADPWLKEYINYDKIGNTLFLVNTIKGENLINELKEREIIEYISTDYNSYYKAQKPNIEKANRIINQREYLKRRIKLMEWPWYRNFFSKNLVNMKIHNYICSRLLVFSSLLNFKKMIIRFFNKATNKIRTIYYCRKFGSTGNHITIQGGVTFNNFKYIHLGNNVGIGANSFFLPVTSYNGKKYNPTIFIGDGTWIGKNCSIAAINSVKIGKNVLFASYVHITDHSHGFEDIEKPVAPQMLITKGPVIIEDDCWLGFGSEILSGVHIGKHSVIGARAVVTHDVPAYTVVAGNPARPIKKYNFNSKKWEKI